MVNTINGKYYQINIKTDSRNYHKDQWTLINHFPNEKMRSQSIQTINIIWQNDWWEPTKLALDKHWTTGIYYIQMT